MYSCTLKKRSLRSLSTRGLVDSIITIIEYSEPDHCDHLYSYTLYSIITITKYSGTRSTTIINNHWFLLYSPTRPLDHLVLEYSPTRPLDHFGLAYSSSRSSQSLSTRVLAWFPLLRCFKFECNQAKT